MGRVTLGKEFGKKWMFSKSFHKGESNSVCFLFLLSFSEFFLKSMGISQASNFLILRFTSQLGDFAFWIPNVTVIFFGPFRLAKLWET